MSSESTPAPESPRQAWNKRYSRTPSLWTPSPNAALVEFASTLPPGRALDLGAGEGRNSVWLATRGWQVTALDISDVALARAAARAAAEGVELRCVAADWRDHELASVALELGHHLHAPRSARAPVDVRARRASAGPGRAPVRHRGA